MDKQQTEDLAPPAPTENGRAESPSPALTPSRPERRRAQRARAKAEKATSAPSAKSPAPPSEPLPDPLPLTEVERMLLEGLMARDREIGLMMADLRGRWKKVWGMIEERLKLPKGAVGKTHIADTDNWEIVVRGGPPPAPPTPPA